MDGWMYKGRWTETMQHDRQIRWFVLKSVAASVWSFPWLSSEGSRLSYPDFDSFPDDDGMNACVFKNKLKDNGCGEAHASA